MKLGLQTYSLHLAFGKHPDCKHHPEKLKISLEDSIEKAAGWGFSTLQIDPVHLNNKSAAYGAKIAKLAKDRGITLELGIGGFHYDTLMEQLHIAEAMDADFVRIFADTGERDNTPESIKEALNYIARNVEKALPFLEQAKIVLGWENHGDFSTDEQISVLSKISHPQFRSCIDVGNAICFLEKPLETVEKLAPWAGGVHFKDYNVSSATFGIKFFGTALGTGILPLKEIVTIIRNRTQLDHLIYEQSIQPVSDNPEESIWFESRTIEKSIRYAVDYLNLEIGKN
jgi:3-oxoisoapionate decarboxylase